ncbi:hypothetical protein ACFQYP_48540 [Nonomuraea antimicrobica]
MRLGEFSGRTVVQGSSVGSATAVELGGLDGQITSPSDGEVVSSSSVTVSARSELLQLKAALYVDGPSTSSQKVAGGGAGQTLSGTFYADSAPNGTFTVTLKGELTGTTYASSTFKLRRPPAAPGSVNASRQGTQKVLLTWNKGSEPDLQSYEVSNAQTGVVGRLPADSACSGSSCKAVLAVPSKVAGQKVGFTVKAFRGDGDGGSIGSADSAAASITFPAPPSAQPKKTPTDSERTSKGSDPKRVEALPTLPAKKQSQSSSKPTTRNPTTTKLPDLPDVEPSGNLPIPTADAQGENGGLASADAKDGANSTPVQSDGVKAQSNESFIGNIGQYGLYVAGGILLLLLGAHVGAWARRRTLSAGGAGGSMGVAANSGPGGDAGTPTAGVRDGTTTHGVRIRRGDGSIVSANAASRRPAVILAVAKTRMPEQPPVARQARAELGADFEPPLGDRRQSRREEEDLGSLDQRPGRDDDSSTREGGQRSGRAADSSLSAWSELPSPAASSSHSGASGRQSSSDAEPLPGAGEASAHLVDRLSGEGLGAEGPAKASARVEELPLREDRQADGRLSRRDPCSDEGLPREVSQAEEWSLREDWHVGERSLRDDPRMEEPLLRRDSCVDEHQSGEDPLVEERVSGRELQMDDHWSSDESHRDERPSPQGSHMDEQTDEGLARPDSRECGPNEVPGWRVIAELRSGPWELSESAGGRAGDSALGASDGRGASQGSVHLALPSSATMDVPEGPSTSAVPPAIRLEERWDDRCWCRVSMSDTAYGIYAERLLNGELGKSVATGSSVGDSATCVVAQWTSGWAHQVWPGCRP